MRGIVDTDEAWSSLILRVVLGVVMFAHGAQKVFGWFGGFGLAGTLGFFTQQLHVPTLLTLLVIGAEFFGGLGLILGFLTRVAALGLVGDMLGAIWLVHWGNGLFMNWAGKQAGEGFEYHLLAIAIGVALMIVGAGRWSVDRELASKLG